MVENTTLYLYKKRLFQEWRDVGGIDKSIAVQSFSYITTKNDQTGSKIKIL